MTQKEMIELVQQHHPHMGEKEVRQILNRASDVFCAETEIIKKSWTQTTAVDTRYYPLDPDIVRIVDVRLDGEFIPRLTNPPKLEDEDFT
jgi:hypothetical protein